MDVYGAHGVFRAVRGAADLPALSGLLAGRAAAHRSPERRGRAEPAACVGPEQPQPAAARRLSGYETQRRTRTTTAHT